MDANFEEMKCKGCGKFECARPYKYKYCTDCIDKVCDLVFIEIKYDEEYEDCVCVSNSTDSTFKYKPDKSITEGDVMHKISITHDDLPVKKKGRPRKEKVKC